MLSVGGELSMVQWAEDGQTLIVTDSTPFEGTIYRVDVATGKRTPLQRVELGDKAGSLLKVRMEYAEKSKTCVYRVSRC